MTTLASSLSKNMKSGIYQIRNVFDDKVYVGSSVNLKQRWCTHKHRLNIGTHGNPHLQNAWNKYGQSAFVFEVLEKVETVRLTQREQTHLDRIFRIGNHYNMAPKANSSLGVKHSPETRAKNSAAQKGKIISQEQREKMSAANKGKRRTAEQRTRQRSRKFTEEHRSNIGLALKSSLAAKNVAAARIGTTRSTETKAKIGAANRGRVPGAEVRAKLSASTKASWERRKAKKEVAE